MSNTKYSARCVERATSTFFHLLLLVTLSLSGCEGAEPVPPNVTRLEGDYVPGGMTSPDVFWLDEYRIIFEGLGGARPSTVEGMNKGTHGIYIWDTRNSKVELYRAQAQALCFHNGFIRYQIARNEKGEHLPLQDRRFYAGRFRKETLQPSAKSDDLSFSRFTCELQQKVRDTDGYAMAALLQGHGYQKFAPGSVHLLDKNENRLINIPISFQYSPWNNSYFFWEPLSPDENVSRTVTYRPPVETSARTYAVPLEGAGRVFVAVRDALLVRAHDARRESFDRSGLYVIDPANESLSLIRAGRVYLSSHPSGGVSSDGCKLVYAYSRSLQDAALSAGKKKYLEVIDMCHKGRKS